MTRAIASTHSPLHSYCLHPLHHLRHRATVNLVSLQHAVAIRLLTLHSTCSNLIKLCWSQPMPIDDHANANEVARILISMNKENTTGGCDEQNRSKRKRSSSSASANDASAPTLSRSTLPRYCPIMAHSDQHCTDDDNFPLRQAVTATNSSHNRREVGGPKPIRRATKQHYFSLIEAICSNEGLTLYITTQFLPPEDFLTLYCISKRFHYLVDSHLTSYILSSARRWAPLTSRFGDPTKPTLPNVYSLVDITTLLPFHHYIHLCTLDPVGRKTEIKIEARPVMRPQKTRNSDVQRTALQRLGSTFIAATPANAPQTRHVPTIRYLYFVRHRSLTVQCILRSLWFLGHRLPPSSASVLIKLWYTLDIPTTGLREALFRNTAYWTDHDLRVLFCICMKLDMAFSDPVDGRGEVPLREMMLAQRTLSVLDDVLARRDCRNMIEMLRHYVRWKYQPRPEYRKYSIMGIPPKEIGCLEKEGWGTMEGAMPGFRSGLVRRLMRPDELALKEAVRRGIDVKSQLKSFMISGYIDPSTLQDYPAIMGFGRGVDASSAPGL